MTLLSRISGFVRDMLVARAFGADAATDAFFVAFKLPNLFRRLFADGSFSQLFVPTLADQQRRLPTERVQAFLDRTAGTFAVCLLALTVIGVLAAPLLVLLFAPGFYQHPDQFQLAAEMVRITLPYIFFVTLTALGGAVLNVSGRFGVPAFTPVLLNLTIIAATIWLAPQLGEPILACAYGVLLGGLLQLLIQIPPLLRLGRLPRARVDFADPDVRRLLRQVGPAMLGVSGPQINLLINTLIASFLATGSVSWLYYSDRLVEFPLGLIGVAIGTAILPHLSESHSQTDQAGFSRALDWSLRWIVLIGVPATVGLMLLSRPLVATLYQYDEFSSHDNLMATRSLICYSSGLMALLALKVLVPGFSARHDVATPARIGVYGVIANLGFSLTLVPLLAPLGWGHGALALATSLAAYGNAGWLLLALLRGGILRPEPGWLRLGGRTALATGAMALPLVYSAAALPWEAWSAGQRVVHLGVWIGCGMLVYAAALWLMGLRPRHLLLGQANAN